MPPHASITYIRYRVLWGNTGRRRVSLAPWRRGVDLLIGKSRVPIGPLRHLEISLGLLKGIRVWKPTLWFLDNYGYWVMKLNIGVYNYRNLNQINVMNLRQNSITYLCPLSVRTHSFQLDFHTTKMATGTCCTHTFLWREPCPSITLSGHITRNSSWFFFSKEHLQNMSLHRGGVQDNFESIYINDIWVWSVSMSLDLICDPESFQNQQLMDNFVCFVYNCC